MGEPCCCPACDHGMLCHAAVPPRPLTPPCPPHHPTTLDCNADGLLNLGGVSAREWREVAAAPPGPRRAMFDVERLLDSGGHLALQWGGHAGAAHERMHVLRSRAQQG